MQPLSPVSYIVLALVNEAGEATPYELKSRASSFAGFWDLRHDQVYREPARLAAQGLLSEEREETGRRRRRFRITDAGRQALEGWLRTPATDFTELRDTGLLQLWLGADPVPLATVQLEAHRQRLAGYERVAAELGPDVPRRIRQVLNAGVGHEREWVRYWSEIAEGREGA